FWTYAKVKTINEDIRLQALVDGKKVIVNEASIRCDLRLDASEGTTCLPNAAIFEELARMRYEKPSQKLTFYKAFFSPQWKFFIHTILQCLNAKTTTWNEFNSTMASVIICLANNQTFNFSMYILDNMVKNLEAEVKFDMFLRFVQVFVNHQLGDMSHHKGIFVNSSLTKKWVKYQLILKTHPFLLNHHPLNPKGSINPEGNKGRKLRVLSLEQTKTNQAAKIEKLKKRVKKLEGKKKKRTHGLKRLYKVGLSARIVSSDEEGCTKKEVSTTADEVITTAAITPQISKDDVTLAQLLIEIKAAKPRARGVIV
nr:hypothetical protein [Tanacetum cinerariifolium]